MQESMSQDRVSRVLFIDDHPLYIDGVCAALKRAGLMLAVEAAHDIRSALQRLGEGPGYDLVLMDWRLPGSDGVQGLTALLAAAPGVPVVVISGVEEPAVEPAARSLGAAGYVAKTASAAQLRQLLVAHLADETSQPGRAMVGDEPLAPLRRLNPLTARQRQVHEQLGRGLSNKAIAAELHMAPTTVRDHVSAILKRLKLSNRTEAALRARAAGPRPNPPKPPSPAAG